MHWQMPHLQCMARIFNAWHPNNNVPQRVLIAAIQLLLLNVKLARHWIQLCDPSLGLVHTAMPLTKEQVLDKLSAAGISYDIFEHAAALTVEAQVQPIVAPPH